MRFQLGIPVCLLAGCVVQPTVSAPIAQSGAAPERPGPSALRIGVEHLEAVTPAFADAPLDRVVVEPLAKTRTRHLAPAAPGNDPERSPRGPEVQTAGRPLHELARTDAPIAREALHFVSDLVDADRRRVAREVGLPFFDFHAVDPDRGPLLQSERELQAEHEEWVQEHGTALLRRPLHRMLRRLPLVRDVELAIEDFRQGNVPLSAPYEETHHRGDHGRVSLRIHADDPKDPLEVVWVQSGVRIGTSQEFGKFGLELELTDRLHMELRARTGYETHEHDLRLDLSYRPSARTSLHVALGDDMDFLSTSSLYSLFETPMDGAPGLVLYAVHVF